MYLLILATTIVASADFEKCVQQTYSSLDKCNGAARNAKAQADALAAAQSQQAANDSLREAADREAGVTQQIMALYGAAQATCAAAAANCKSACTGEDADIGQACGGDIGDYQAQLDPGQFQNAQGHKGSLASKGLSSGRSAGAAGGQVTPAQATDSPSAKGAESLTNEVQVRDLSNILQRPDGAEDVSGGEVPGGDISSDSASGTHRASTADSSATRGQSLAGGTAGRKARGAIEGPSNANVAANEDESEQKVGGGKNKAAAFSAVESAILTRCLEQKNMANEECHRLVSRSFCGEPRNRACPTCQGLTSDQVMSAQGLSLQQICTQACAQDPAFGPQVAHVCRAMFQEREVASGFPTDVATQHLGLFEIHENAIHRACQRMRRNC